MIEINQNFFTSITHIGFDYKNRDSSLRTIIWNKINTFQLKGNLTEQSIGSYLIQLKIELSDMSLLNENLNFSSPQRVFFLHNNKMVSYLCFYKLERIKNFNEPSHLFLGLQAEHHAFIFNNNFNFDFVFAPVLAQVCINPTPEKSFSYSYFERKLTENPSTIYTGNLDTFILYKNIYQQLLTIHNVKPLHSKDWYREKIANYSYIFKNNKEGTVISRALLSETIFK